jgi:hypothetical protein
MEIPSQAPVAKSANPVVTDFFHVEETCNLYEYDISISGVGCCARPVHAAYEACEHGHENMASVTKSFAIHFSRLRTIY